MREPQSSEIAAAGQVLPVLSRIGWLRTWAARFAGDPYAAMFHHGRQLCDSGDHQSPPRRHDCDLREAGGLITRTWSPLVSGGLGPQGRPR
jgi:hypothetical protein